MTWTATLATSKPAARTRRTVSASRADARGAGPLRLGGAEVAAQVAEAGGGQQRVAGGVRGDVGVGVPGQSGGLVGPGQPGQHHRCAVGEPVDVGSDADTEGRVHEMIMPERPWRVSTPRGVWSAAGIVAGLAGLAVSHGATMALTLRSSPIVAVGELVVQYVPGVVAERAIEILGHWDKTVLVLVIFLLLLSLWAWAGRLAARSWWQPILVFVALGGVGLLAALTRYDARALDVLPVAAGTVTWIVVLSFLTDPLQNARTETAEQGGRTVEQHAHTRRTFLIRAGIIAALAGVVGVFGERLGRRRRHVEQSRRLLKLPVTNPNAPRRSRVDAPGNSRWKTPNEPLLPDPHRDRLARDRARASGACGSTAWSTARSR